jgi:hypothetical protein
MNLHRSTRLLVAPLIALALLAAVVGLKVSRDKHEARSLISDAEELTQKRSSPTAVNEFLSKHRSWMRRDRKCNESKCSYDADLENSLLTMFHLAPQGKLVVLVSTERGQIGEVYIAAVAIIAGRQSAAVVLSQSPSTCGAGCESFDVGRTRDSSSGKVKLSYIKLGPSATPAQRKLAFQISTDCIFSIGGCADLSAITPTDFGPDAGSDK